MASKVHWWSLAVTTKDDKRVDFDKLWQKISKGVGQLSEKDKAMLAAAASKKWRRKNESGKSGDEKIN